MNRALWLLIGLQTRGWGRSLVRNLRTVKGALLIIVAVAALGMWLWAVVQSPRNTVDASSLRRFGPAFFLAYCLLSVLFSGGQRALYFNPAEVNFLFTGPFTRRQLLGYKITVQALIAVPMALFFLLVFRINASWSLAAFVALYLSLLFLQVFSLCVGVVADMVGVKAYSQSRRRVLIVVAVCATFGLALAARHFGGFSGLVALIETSTIWKVVTAPLATFMETFLVQSGDWPALLTWGGLAALVTLVFIAGLMLLDAHFLESAATSSERVYNLIQRMRRGEATNLEWGSSDKPRFSLSPFPWWGGAGPIAWRQATTALRSLSRLAILALPLAIITLPSLFGKQKVDNWLGVIAVLGGLAWLSVFLSTLVMFDFRGDVERIEVLKTLPVPAWRLVLGQVMTPVAIMLFLQTLCLVALMFGNVLDVRKFILAVAFALPLNLLLFGVDNLLFLWFPSRAVVANPGDLQALGRNMVMILGKMALLLIVGVVAFVLGWVITHFGGSLAAAFVTGWLVLMVFAFLMVPLMALAFQGFDVSRDVPA